MLEDQVTLKQTHVFRDAQPFPKRSSTQHGGRGSLRDEAETILNGIPQTENGKEEAGAVHTQARPYTQGPVAPCRPGWPDCW